ncbi:dTDP-4-amino-4,6-dideoxy-D-glucose transaminase [bioreactor metagenome]|uniref:dTDP-4-amino-4,6-dideoxy-D-glucose transaminase n=1 Tax=bioreactor metagenome TaxID=1076179 RepID=A0A644YE30_9ZZZZ
MSKPIYVTEPSLPPLEEFIPYLKRIWDNKWLTNNGEFHQEFETRLAEYLGVKYVSLFTNGMIALQVGMQALRITGEVITTPFTFVATPHAIHWNNCQPVFCDIEPETFTMDPDKVEALITPRTTAIMPVHVYGNPCCNGELKQIADTYGLKLFYDAAHGFGVKKDGVSVCNWGDLSMLSFHATKVFNTFEGGALVTNDEKMKSRIDFLKNFGFADEVTVVAPGSNGKMDEFRAAYGLLQLERVDGEIVKRKRVAEHYRQALKEVPGIQILHDQVGIQHNYAYFPVRIHAEQYGMSRDGLYDRLKERNIMSRRYFYPLCSDFPTYRSLPSAMPSNLPVATKIAQEILCLPMFADLREEMQQLIINEIYVHAK